MTRASVLSPDLPGKHRWPGWRSTQTCLHWQRTHLCSTADTQQPAVPPALPGTCSPWETKSEGCWSSPLFNKSPLRSFTSVFLNPYLYALKKFSASTVHLSVCLQRMGAEISKQQQTSRQVISIREARL